MEPTMKRLLAAAALAFTAAQSVALEIDKNKWFAYYHRPPAGRGMVEVTVLLSKEKCHLPKHGTWKAAMIYYGSRQVRHCWNESDNPKIIGICEPQMKDGELRLLRGGCQDAYVSEFISTNSLPKAAF